MKNLRLSAENNSSIHSDFAAPLVFNKNITIFEIEGSTPEIVINKIII